MSMPPMRGQPWVSPLYVTCDERQYRTGFAVQASQSTHACATTLGLASKAAWMSVFACAKPAGSIAEQPLRIAYICATACPVMPTVSVIQWMMSAACVPLQLPGLLLD